MSTSKKFDDIDFSQLTSWKEDIDKSDWGNAKPKWGQYIDDNQDYLKGLTAADYLIPEIAELKKKQTESLTTISSLSQAKDADNEKTTENSVYKKAGTTLERFFSEENPFVDDWDPEKNGVSKLGERIEKDWKNGNRFFKDGFEEKRKEWWDKFWTSGWDENFGKKVKHVFLGSEGTDYGKMWADWAEKTGEHYASIFENILGTDIDFDNIGRNAWENRWVYEYPNAIGARVRILGEYANDPFDAYFYERIKNPDELTYGEEWFNVIYSGNTVPGIRTGDGAEVIGGGIAHLVNLNKAYYSINGRPMSPYRATVSLKDQDFFYDDVVGDYNGDNDSVLHFGRASRRRTNKRYITHASRNNVNKLYEEFYNKDNVGLGLSVKLALMNYYRKKGHTSIVGLSKLFTRSESEGSEDKVDLKMPFDMKEGDLDFQRIDEGLKNKFKYLENASDLFRQSSVPVDYSLSKKDLGKEGKNANRTKELAGKLKESNYRIEPEAPKLDVPTDTLVVQQQTLKDIITGTRDKFRSFKPAPEDTAAETRAQDDKIKEHNSLDKIVPPDPGKAITGELKNSIYSNNFNVFMLIFPRKTSADIQSASDYLNAAIAEIGKANGNIFSLSTDEQILSTLIKASLSYGGRPMSGDSNSLYNKTFMYRSEGFFIPEVTVKTIEVTQYGHTLIVPYYDGLASFGSSHGKIKFKLDDPQEVFLSMFKMSGGLIKKETTLLSNLRDFTFYNKYEVALIASYFSLENMRNQAYGYQYSGAKGLRKVGEETKAPELVDWQTMTDNIFFHGNKEKIEEWNNKLKLKPSTTFALTDVKFIGSEEGLTLGSGSSERASLSYGFTFNRVIPFATAYANGYKEQ